MRNRFLLALALSFFVALGMTGALAQLPGPTPDANPEGNTGACKARIETGGGYDAHSGNASRSVTDLRVPGALGIYGLDFTRHWNSIPPDEDQAQAVWPTDFGDSGWGHSWGWSAMESEDILGGGDQGEEIWVTTIAITFPDGHANMYKISRSAVYHGQPWWNLHPGPWFGAPYYAAEGAQNWPLPGESVRDWLEGMAEDGHEFWLYLADGGAVHFEGFEPDYGGTPWAHWNYRATEVFDPHGFKTELLYENQRLKEVRQEGGRSLILTWGSFLNNTRTLITKVETRGSTEVQGVSYKYTRFPDANGSLLTLAKATYLNDPAPGQGTAAVYTYSGIPPSGFPILTTADDPRFAGPMTKIAYAYRGGECLMGQHPYFPAYFNALFDFFLAKPESIAVEYNAETGVAVSRFVISCFNGTRSETNGFDAWRFFYFGRSASNGVAPTPYHIKGYQLAKVTDFTKQYPLPAGLPFQHQNYMGGQPREVWDGRGLKSVLIGGPDDSLEPGEIHHPDGNVEHYNRSNSAGSDAPDPAFVRNPHLYLLFSKTDERNKTTLYRRDSRRRIKQIDYPDGASSEYFTYNYLNQVETHTLPSGAILHYDYDGFHRLWREWNETDGVAEATIYTYDTLDRVATVQNARAAANYKPFSAKMEYNGRHKVTKVTYPSTTGGADPFVTYQYDNYGNCIKITDELGHQSTYTYDSYRRCTSMTEQLNAPGWDGGASVASRRWDWIYDRYIEGVPYAASSHTSREWRVQVEPVFNSAGDRRLSAHKFDCNNRIIEEVTGMIEFANGSWNTGPDTEVHSFTYDKNGQKSSYTDSRSRLTTYDYDNRNRLWKTNETVNTIPRTTETLYDPAGNKTLVKFPDQKMQQWLYHDGFGQPRQFIDERNNVTDLSYWPWGPMKKLGEVITHRAKDGGGTEDQSTRFYYDYMGRPQNTYFPDNSHEYTGYEFGQVKVWETRKRQTKTVHYDARGREDYHTWANGAAPKIIRTWDDANRLTSIRNTFSFIDYGYDDAGQAKWEGNNITGSPGRVQTTYWRYPSGEVSRMTYPNGSTTLTRNYTARGQLQRVDWGSGNTSYVYLKDGRVDQQDYGNGVQSKYEYDGRGMISALRHKKSANGPDLTYREYWRDERDRITAWRRGTESSQNAMEDGRGDRYQYDWEGQLTSASYRTHDPAGSAGDPMRNDIFSYDALGNRVRSNYLASRGWLDFTRKDNGLNQYSGWWNYSVTNYDDDLGGVWGSPGHANGVLMQDGWITGSYNALNQPVSMWSPAFANTANWMWFGHDPLGRCVKRWIGPSGTLANSPTYFYYDGWSLVQEGSSASNSTRVYVHGGRVDEIVAQITPGNNWRYFQYDARGHCTLQTDASGDIVEQYDYDAFGFPYFYNRAGDDIHSSPWGNRFLFTGREWISELRTYDFRNRMYQPELGRFLQPDPKQFAAGDYNLYRYCHNDPANKSDPFGLELSLEMFSAQSSLQRTGLNAIPTSTGTYTVGAHGNPQGVADDRGMAKDLTGRSLGSRSLTAIIQQDSKFAGTKEIILYSCSTGKGNNPLAQQVANRTNLPVWAPDNLLWVNKKGVAFIGPRKSEDKMLPNGEANPDYNKPDYKKPGGFIRFLPHIR
jgi:RHS repeat-associated protein